VNPTSIRELEFAHDNGCSNQISLNPTSINELLRRFPLFKSLAKDEPFLCSFSEKSKTS